MVFENVRFEHGNLTVDVADGAGFVTMDHDVNKLIKKTSAGAVTFSYFLDTDIINEVVSLEHDGHHYWSLERSGLAGFIVRKWLIGADNLVRVVSTASFSSSMSNNYKVYTMAVEWYQDDLDGAVVVNDTSFDVSDGSVVQIGDKLSIGPSTFAGFIGDVAETTITNKVGNTLTVSPAVTASFTANDPIYFTRSLFIFSDEAPFNTNIGSLYKLDPITNGVLAINTSNMFFGIRAATFFKNKLMFIKGGEIIWLNPLSQTIFKSQAIDNLELFRGAHYNAFDLAGFSDTIYRLEDHKVFLNGSDEYEEEIWAELNYNTSNTVPEVYFLAVKANPPMLHAAVAGLTPTSRITVQVLDQFRTPVFNRLVSLASTGGALSPTSDTTDADGFIVSTYTTNSTVGLIEIEASVT